ncbi:hypothetical protein N0A02_15265 [Paraburkholderia acidicola]|uniref:Uncharacterized protein n=1 Tax=Paraburkholderia acidicola TaxID=1912599 RepID=A0ABV1LNF0_9BURK
MADDNFGFRAMGRRRRRNVNHSYISFADAMIRTNLAESRGQVAPGGSTENQPLETTEPQSPQRATIPGLSDIQRSSLRAPAGTSGTAAHSRRASLQNIATTAPPPPPPPVESATDRETRRAGIHSLVSAYFEPHIITDEEATNRGEFDELINDRVQGLLEMGESPADIKATFSKGSRIGYAGKALEGFAGSVPFGLASRVMDTRPAIGETVVAGLNHLPGIKNTPDAFKGGFAGGIVSHAADHIGSQAKARTLKTAEDTEWLSAPSEMLEGPMVNAKAAAQAGMWQKVRQSGTAVETFALRDVAIGVAAPVITAAGYAAEAVQFNSWASAIGSGIAGAGASMTGRYFAAKNHRIGPEYLLGRTDWDRQYAALKAATWKDASANGIGRVAHGVSNLVNATLSAPHTITSATSETTGLIGLAVGLGTVALATDAGGALAKNMGASPAGIVAAGQAARTASSVVVFPTWAALGEVTDPGVAVLRAGSDAVGNLVQKGVSGAIRTSAETIGEGTQAGADYAGPKLRSARDAVVQTGQATIEGVSTGISNIGSAIGTGVTNVGSAVSTGVTSMGSGMSSGIANMGSTVSATAANLFRRTRNENTQDAAADTSNPEHIPLPNVQQIV